MTTLDDYRREDPAYRIRRATRLLRQVPWDAPPEAKRQAREDAMKALVGTGQTPA